MVPVKTAELFEEVEPKVIEEKLIDKFDPTL